MSLILALWTQHMDHQDRAVAITEFLTASEIKQAARLYQETKGTQFAHQCAEQIIKPVLDRINTTLGQQNDALYLAYAVEYVFNTLGKDKIKMLLE